jgi:hypothetical protein
MEKIMGIVINPATLGIKYFEGTDSHLVFRLRVEGREISPQVLICSEVTESGWRLYEELNNSDEIQRWIAENHLSDETESLRESLPMTDEALAIQKKINLHVQIYDSVMFLGISTAPIIRGNGTIGFLNRYQMEWSEKGWVILPMRFGGW